MSLNIITWVTLTQSIQNAGFNTIYSNKGYALNGPQVPARLDVKTEVLFSLVFPPFLYPPLKTHNTNTNK